MPGLPTAGLCPGLYALNRIILACTRSQLPAGAPPATLVKGNGRANILVNLALKPRLSGAFQKCNIWEYCQSTSTARMLAISKNFGGRSTREDVFHGVRVLTELLDMSTLDGF